MKFSTVRFLQMAQKTSSRRIRMENFLLMLLRMLIMAFIAVAFAMPMLRTKNIGKVFGRVQRDIAIVLDGSYSMEYSTGKDTAWTKALEAATALVEGLEEGDKVCLFMANNDVVPVIERLNNQKDFVLSQLKGLRTGNTSSQLAPALLAANNSLKLETARHEREIHIFTDGHALPWNSFTITDTNSAQAIDVKDEKPGKKEDKKDEKKETKKEDKKDDKKAGKKDDKKDKGKKPDKDGKDEGVVKSASVDIWQPTAIDKKTAIFVTITGVPAPENTAPMDVELQPQLIMSDTIAKVKFKAIHCGPAQNSTVTVYVDDQEVGSRAVIFDGTGTAEEILTLPMLKPGKHSARIQTPADNLPMDNSFYFTLRVKEKLPTLCVGGQDETFFVMKAMNPSGEANSTINVKQVPSDQLSTEKLNEYSCVFLCNALPLAGQDLVLVEQYVRSGGLLVIFPGDKAAVEDYKVWSVLPAMPSTLNEPPTEQRKKMLRWEKPQHPVVRTLQLPPGMAPSVTISRHLKMVKADFNSEAETIISAGSEMPFLLYRPVGNGGVILLTVAADRSWSNFPLSPFFLPLIQQIVMFGAGIQGEAPYVWSTMNLPLIDNLPEATQNSVIQNPNKENMPIRPVVNDGKTSLYLENVTIPGIYKLTPENGNAEPAMAVNISREESDLTALKKEDIPKKLGTKIVFTAESKDELTKLIKDYRVGQTMGEQMLWILLLLSIVEVFYANRLARANPKLSDSLGIEASGKITEQQQPEQQTE